MPLTISYLFDLEAQRKDSLIINLGNCSEMFFQDKEYSFLVQDIIIELFCFVTPFRMECRKRPLYIEDKMVSAGIGFPKNQHIYHFLFINIPLPDEFITCPYEESLIIVRDAVIGYFREKPLPVKLRKSFDMERFIDDLTTFFERIDLRTGMWKTEEPIVS